jgi:gliding motility-associated-like protein
MKVFALILFCFSFSAMVFAQQIVVDNSGANGVPANLVGLIQGGGVTTSNVTFTGNQGNQIARFTNGFGAIGINKGVVLSTGKVTTIAQPNDTTNTSGTNGNSGGTDADLLALSGNVPVFDWVILEFDAQVSGDQLKLLYAFASEEYGEFVCSPNADVFGILVSGPGIAGSFSNGAQLISTVPSTSNPAGINSINNGVVGQFGVAGGCSNASASPYYNANTSGLFEFDGFSDVMTASVSTQCDSVYHIKIVLADVNADGFDSGLFLSDLGVFSNSPGSYSNPVYNDSLIVEGCRAYDIVFYNANGFGSAQTIPITISGTAQNGVDYTAIPTSYAVSATDSMIVLQIVPIADGLNEGTESVIISFDLLGPCNDTIRSQFEVYILNENPLQVTGFPSNQTICDGETVFLGMNVSGGFPAYTIQWNGVFQNNISVTPTQDITYVAELSDLAGCYWTNSFTVDHNPMPTVNAGPDLSLCKNNPTTLGATIDGGSGATYTWFPASQLNSANVPYPVMTPTTNQSYTITVTSSAGCVATDNLSITVLPIPTVDAGQDESIVYLQTTATLSGIGNASPSWSPADGLSCTNCFQPEASPLMTTTYTLTVTGGNGCLVSDQVTVVVEVPKDVFVPSAFSPNGDGNNDELFVRCYTMYAMNFRVYDIWGGLMFETTDINKGWDGKVSGQEASVGVYYYTAEVFFINNEGSVVVSGQVNLVR